MVAYKLPTAAQFNKLTNLKKRVVIAKDVLKQIEAERYIQTRDQYFGFTVPAPAGRASSRYDSIARVPGCGAPTAHRPLRYSSLQVKPFLTGANKKVQCHVCAKGAAICSLTRIVNKRTFAQLDSEDSEIVDIFGRTIWDAMESMFEGYNPYSEPVSLEDIMKNIIKNKGRLQTARGMLD